jgi:hypothetical protein
MAGLEANQMSRVRRRPFAGRDRAMAATHAESESVTE